jgi:hypothetical protein
MFRSSSLHPFVGWLVGWFMVFNATFNTISLHPSKKLCIIFHDLSSLSVSSINVQLYHNMIIKVLVQGLHWIAHHQINHNVNILGNGLMFEFL